MSPEVSPFIQKIRRQEQLEKEQKQKREEEDCLSNKEKLEAELGLVKSRIKNVQLDIKNGFNTNLVTDKLKILEESKKRLEEEIGRT